MENNKQTAVDFLIEQLQAPCRGIPSHIIEQAKQMEKEEIINLIHFMRNQDKMGKSIKDLFEQYYNETFKSE